MFRSFTIRNFRCFRDFSIDSLDRINLIAGKNNVGKTALLEAIFLHLAPNNPELKFKIDIFRGIKTFTGDAETTWGDMFFADNIHENIELTSIDKKKLLRSLHISLVEPEDSQEIESANDKSNSTKIVGSQATTIRQKELLYEYINSEGRKGVSRISITDEGVIKGKVARIEPIPPGIFISTRLGFPEEDAERFSRIERAGQEEKILNTMKILEPRLRRLAVLITGGKPMVSGNIGIGPLVPLPLMGEGMVRLFSIVLAIAEAPNGFVLIDEIENGLHYSVMVDVWKAIADAARRSGTQIFATTHSWDCIRAANQAFKNSKRNNFRLHRLDRKDDTIKSVIYDKETLEAALTADLEVR